MVLINLCTKERSVLRNKTVKTKYWKKISANRVQCELCPQFCKLTEGSRGICFVRGCEKGEVVSLTYGRSSGFAIDPIEKKPLYHFLPGSQILSFGTAGCNLQCSFCQNWHMTKTRQSDILSTKALPEDIAQMAKQQGCPSVAFTYNDPVVFFEYAIDTARACHELGVKTVAVTAGMICEKPREEFFQHMDAANIDLKGFTEEFYRKHCKGDLNTVLETLLYVKQKTKTWLEITTLLIPGENDSEEEIDRMTHWIAVELGVSVPLHFSAFHPDFKMQDKPRTPTPTLLRAREIARENGLRYVYTGNIQDNDSQATYCHQCNKLLIARNGYHLGSCQYPYPLVRGTSWLGLIPSALGGELFWACPGVHTGDLTENKCLFCGAECAGVF